MRRNILTGAAVALAGALTIVSTAAPANADTTTPLAPGATTSSQQVLGLDVGTLVGLDLLTDTASASLGDAAAAAATITGVKLSSSAIPGLNLAFPTVTASQPTGAATDSSSLSLGQTLAQLAPSLSSAADLVDSAGGVVGGDVLPMSVAAALGGTANGANGSAGLADLAVGGGLARVQALSSKLLHLTNADASGVSRTLHIDAVGLLDIGTLLALLGTPLDQLSLADVSALVQGLGVQVTGLPGGQTLQGAADPLVATVDALLTQANTQFADLTSQVQGVIIGALGNTPAGSTLVSQLDPSVLSDLQAQLVGLLSSALSALDTTPLVRLDAVDATALTKATDDPATSTATSSCGLGSLQIGNLAAIDLTTLTGGLGQLATTVNGILGSLPLGLGSLLNLSICGQTLVGTTPTTGTAQSVTSDAGTVLASAASTAIALRINPGAVLSGLTQGSPLGGLFDDLALGNLPVLGDTLAGTTLATLLGGATSVVQSGIALDIADVHAQAAHAAAVIDLPPTTGVPVDTLARTGGDQGFALLAGAALAPVALVGLRLRRRPS